MLPGSLFASERSFAQFRLPDEEGKTAIGMYGMHTTTHTHTRPTHTPPPQGFGQQPNTLLVIGGSGTFYVASFDVERGGACEERHSCRFLELHSDL